MYILRWRRRHRAARFVVTPTITLIYRQLPFLLRQSGNASHSTRSGRDTDLVCVYFFFFLRLQACQYPLRHLARPGISDLPGHAHAGDSVRNLVQLLFPSNASLSVSSQSVSRLAEPLQIFDQQRAVVAVGQPRVLCWELRRTLCAACRSPATATCRPHKPASGLCFPDRFERHLGIDL